MDTKQFAESRGLCRRTFLKGTGAAVAAVVLAACSQATPKTPAEPQPTAEAATVQPITEPTAPPVAATTEVVEIEFWNPMSSPANKEIMPKVFDDFMAEYPHIKVEYELSGGPPGGGDFIEVLLSRVAGGNPPDAAMLWSPAKQFAVKGALYPLDDFMANAKYGGKDKWLPWVLSSCMWKGAVYALPTSAANGAMFMNTALFENKGQSTKREEFPKTWDELKDLAATFNEWEGDVLKVTGYVPWATGWTRPVWSQLNGGRWFDGAANKYVLDSEQNQEWLNYMVGWLDEQFKGDVEKVNQSATFEGIWNGTAYYQGIEAMCDDGSWALTNDVPEEFHFEVARYPVGPSGSKSVTPWYPNWEVVLKGAKHPQEAFLFQEYFCTIGWLRWYEEGCPEMPAWTDADVSNRTNKKLISLVGEERAKEVESFFLTYLREAGMEMWTSPIESYAADVIGSAIDEVLHKTKKPAEALANAQQLCQTKLDEVLAS